MTITGTRERTGERTGEGTRDERGREGRETRDERDERTRGTSSPARNSSSPLQDGCCSAWLHICSEFLCSVRAAQPHSHGRPSFDQPWPRNQAILQQEICLMMMMIMIRRLVHGIAQRNVRNSNAGVGLDAHPRCTATA